MMRGSQKRFPASQRLFNDPVPALVESAVSFARRRGLGHRQARGLPIDRPRAGGVSLDDHLDGLRLGFQREPAAVHRLDQDTSGCLLLARRKAHKRYAAAFEARLVESRISGGRGCMWPRIRGTIALNLSKISSAEKGWRMIPARAGKPAVTHWRVA